MGISDSNLQKKGCVIAKYYQFEYSSDELFETSVYLSGNLTVLNITPPTQEPGTYYWHVRASDEAGNWSSWSTAREITILPLITVAPSQVLPANGATVTTARPSFSWSDVPYGVEYEIHIDNNSSLTSPEIKKTLNETEFTSEYLLNGTYYWKVRAINSEGEAGAWSGIRSVVVKAPLDVNAPSDPTGLMSTTHTVSEYSDKPVIVMSWNNDSDDGVGIGVSGYSITWNHSQYVTSDTTVDQDVEDNTNTSPPLADGVWYFHLRTCDLVGNCSTGLTSGPYLIDQNPPSNPSSVNSTTHTAEGFSNLNQIAINWTSDASDGDGSGLAGFSILWDDNPTTDPDTTVDVDPAIFSTTSHELEDGAWYFHLRTCDNVNFCSETVHVGPFTIDREMPSNPRTINSGHVVNEINTEENIIHMSWSSDAEDVGPSGLQGYSIEWDHNPDTTPDSVIELESNILSATSEILENGTWYFHIRTCDKANNCSDPLHSGPYIIDLPDQIPPTNPTALSSTEHAVGEYSNKNIVVMTWSEDASDTGGSGLAGYSTLWDQETDTQPDTILEWGNDVFTETSDALADGDWYFHLRTCDGDANCSDAMHIGPYKIDTTAPTNATTVTSSSHTVGSTNVTDNTIDMTWSADAEDGTGSGVAGVSVLWDEHADTLPDSIVDHGSSIHSATSRPLQNGSWYFHLRTCDYAGNCSEAAHSGPYYLNLPSETLSGTISKNTTLGGNGELYKLSGSLTIANGATVTVLPGTVIKASSTSSLITVNGVLNVQGTSEQPVVFTSWKDDSIRGDSNGDGTSTSPAPGDWSGIVVTDTGSVTMDQAEIRYGGYNTTYSANLYLTKNAQATLENSVVRNSKYAGIRVYTTTSGKTTQLAVRNSVVENNLTRGIYVDASSGVSNPLEITTSILRGNGTNGLESNNLSSLSMDDNQILNNGGYALYFYLNGGVMPGLGDLTLSGNGKNGIALVGPFTQNTTLPVYAEIPYIVTSSGWTVNTGTTLTIPAGTVVKAEATGSLITVNGTLLALGTAESRVIFTSIKDDSVGGDTNNDGTATSPAAGNWSGISFTSTSTGSIMDFGVVNYGGYNSNGNIKITSSLVQISNCLILNSSTYGIFGTALVNANIENNQFNNNVSYAAYLGFTTFNFVSLAGNSGTNNGTNGIYINGSTISQDIILPVNAGFPFVFSSIQINSGKALTLPPGSVIKLMGAITVNGTLNAVGNSTEPITFTSLKDDTAGGDTNNDGNSTEPAKGDWQGIYVWDGGVAVLNHTILRYGGGDYNYDYTNALVRVDEGGNLTLTNSRLEHSRKNGVYVYGVEEQAILNNTITDCTGSGIYVYDFDREPDTQAISPEIRGNVINDSQYPIFLESFDGYTGENRITGNTGTGNTRNYIRMPRLLTGDVKLGTSNGFEWVFEYGADVPAGAVWELGADEVIKVKAYNYSDAKTIYVKGTLRVNTTAGHPVVFTSIDDDAYGEAIGSRAPAKGDWQGIYVWDGGVAVLNHTILRYGGGDYNYDYTNALVRVDEGGNLTLTNSRLEHSRKNGVYVRSNNHYITGNRFYNITSYAIYNGNTSNILVRAENNWFGSNSGPNPYGTGYGINYRTCVSPVTNARYICEYYVDADPWIGKAQYVRAQLGQNVSYQAYDADPVNTANGNYAYQHSDISIPVIGDFDFDFSRSYNSLDPFVNNGMGFGWTHSYKVTLEEAEDKVTVSYGDGRQSQFNLVEGTYQSPPSNFDVLTKEVAILSASHAKITLRWYLIH